MMWSAILKRVMYCRYVPLFEYFVEFSDVAFRVLADNYVTSDSGTGVVHMAPAFGEDDYRVCIENQVINKVRSSCCTSLLKLFIHAYSLFVLLSIPLILTRGTQNMQMVSNHNKSIYIYGTL